MVSLFSAFHLQRSLNLHHKSNEYQQQQQGPAAKQGVRGQQHEGERGGSNPSAAVVYPVEDQIPNPPVPADGYSAFSSCLLVMDDNHRLTEWLAYHYHVLPLRYMVVGT
jgi:hypothetical protein